jgi:hypothetical protein
VRAAAVVLAALGAAVAVAFGIVLVLLDAAGEMLGEDAWNSLSTSRAVLWFMLALVGGVAAARIRQEPRRAAVVLAVVAIGGLVACGAWWIVVAPFPAAAALLAWAGRAGATARS